jgi:hypothetical protein
MEIERRIALRRKFALNIENIGVVVKLEAFVILWLHFEFSTFMRLHQTLFDNQNQITSRCFVMQKQM